jgi:SPX domain protein involved in polyphosphate accumulation
LESEIKFIVPNHGVKPLMNFVRSRCQIDSSFPSAEISSIYYDSEFFHYLDEKINSDFLKSKYRLRWYRDPATGTFSSSAYMEAKFRTGSKRSKHRIKSQTSPNQLSVSSLNDSVIIKEPETLYTNGIIPEHHLFPMFTITYNRQRYLEPISRCRISIDTDIHVPKINGRFLPTARPASIMNAVVEVKGDLNMLPPALYSLTGFGMRKASFSKYLSCYASINNVVYDPR